MELLRSNEPIARKEYTCMLCGGKINKGERYERQTCTDGYMYEFINHLECQELATRLDMYDDCDNGLHDYEFRENIDTYIYNNHYDDELDDYEVEWQNLSCHDTVLKILDELNVIDSQPHPDFKQCIHFNESLYRCQLSRRRCTLKGKNNRRCYNFRTDNQNKSL